MLPGAVVLGYGTRPLDPTGTEDVMAGVTEETPDEVVLAASVVDDGE